MSLLSDIVLNGITPSRLLRLSTELGLGLPVYHHPLADVCAKAAKRTTHPLALNTLATAILSHVGDTVEDGGLATELVAGGYGERGNGAVRVTNGVSLEQTGGTREPFFTSDGYYPDRELARRGWLSAVTKAADAGDAGLLGGLFDMVTRGWKGRTLNKYKFKGEDCPKCGASMEGDPDSGKCNGCGHKWGRLITSPQETEVENWNPQQPRDAHGKFTKVPNPGSVIVIKQLGGSTGAKLVLDDLGRKWMMKTGPSKGALINEAMADEAYRRLGIPVPDGGLHTDKATGEVTKFTRFLDGSQTLGEWEKGKTPAEIQAMHDQIKKGFAADALLANWDVIGLSKDNVLVHNGVAYRVDNGGALEYRAQGTKKTDAEFGTSVTELKTMLDPSKNPHTAEVFKGIDPVALKQQIDMMAPKLQSLLDTMETNKDLAAKLGSRFVDLSNSPLANVPPKAGQTAVPNTPHQLSKHAIDFMHGQGWGSFNKTAMMAEGLTEVDINQLVKQGYLLHKPHPLGPMEDTYEIKSMPPKAAASPQQSAPSSGKAWKQTPDDQVYSISMTDKLTAHLDANGGQYGSGFFASMSKLEKAKLGEELGLSGSASAMALSKAMLEKYQQIKLQPAPTGTKWPDPIHGFKPPAPTATPSSPASAVHLHSGQGVASYLQKNIPAHLKGLIGKMELLNPDGVKNGVFLMQDSPGNPQKEKDLLEHLKKVLPNGTIIKKSYASKEQIKAGNITSVKTPLGIAHGSNAPVTTPAAPAVQPTNVPSSVTTPIQTKVTQTNAPTGTKVVPMNATYKPGEAEHTIQKMFSLTDPSMSETEVKGHVSAVVSSLTTEQKGKLKAFLGMQAGESGTADKAYQSLIASTGLNPSPTTTSTPYTPSSTTATAPKQAGGKKGVFVKPTKTMAIDGVHAVVHADAGAKNSSLPINSVPVSVFAGYAFHQVDEAHLPDMASKLPAISSNSKVVLPKTKDYVSDAIQSEWHNSLTGDQSNAVSDWKSDSTYVRQGFYDALKAGEPLGKTQLAMVEAIQKAPPQPGVYYRGVQNKNGYGDQLVAEAKKALASGNQGWMYDVAPHGMSTHPSTASGFSGKHTVLRIASKSARSLRGIHNYSSEDEILGVPGARYRVKAIHENVTFKGVTHKYVIDMEEI